MSKNIYLERIDKVIAYIQNNFHNKISLDEMAEVSHFSKFHFSRVFTSVIGTTPLVYLTSVRLNQSISYLGDSNKSILEISNLCGFESVSNFNVAFKKHFNQTPSEVRKLSKNISNFSKYLGNKQKEINNYNPYHEVSSDNSFLRRIWQMNISIKELNDLEVAFVRHVGSYLEASKAWEQLGSWAGNNAIFPPEQTYIGISLDDPSTTDEFNCRYDACVTIPKGFKKDNIQEVQFKILPGGLYGKYDFFDTVDRLGIAYQSIFGQWLPNSEYDPDERYCLEFCMNNPFEDPEGKAKVDLYIPLKVRTRSI